MNIVELLLVVVYAVYRKVLTTIFVWFIILK
jgi:hypothetical protein